MSLLITTMGFFGGLVMSAIKRDRGVQDYGTLVTGHGGVLDRIDSICFAAADLLPTSRDILAVRAGPARKALAGRVVKTPSTAFEESRMAL